MADLGAIADVVLPDSFEREHRLGDFWAEQPVVVVWLRHYG